VVREKSEGRVIDIYMTIKAESRSWSGSLHGTQGTGEEDTIACTAISVDGIEGGIGSIAAKEEMTADSTEHKDVDAIETMVETPAVADGRVRLEAREAFKTFAGGRIEAVGSKGHVIDGSVGSAGAEIPRLLDFLPTDVDNDNAKACGQVGVPVGKPDVEDTLVARNLATLNVREVVGMPIDKQVDIRVVVCHHETAGRGVIGESCYAHVVQSVTLGERRQGDVVEVIAEHRAKGTGIDLVRGGSHMIHQRIVEAVTPMANSGLGK
jgi:hypothetical protein